MLIGFLTMRLLPIAAVSAVLYIAAWLLFRKRFRARPFARHAAAYAFTGYCVSLLYLTILWYYPDITFQPGWHSLNLRPFIWLTEVYDMGAWKMAKQLLLNIAMFIPLGVLLPVLFPRQRRFWLCALTALLTTLTIETLQYFMGRSADIDDVIMNLAGGMLGWLLFAWLNQRLQGCPWWRGMLGANLLDGMHPERDHIDDEAEQHDP